SANGVLVNGVRIAQPTELVPGMHVEISEFRLEVEPLQEAAAVPPIADPQPPAPEEPAPAAAPPLPLRLVAEGGPFDGRVFDLPPGQVTVGRSADNGLVFDDPSLSRRHCHLRQ